MKSFSLSIIFRIFRKLFFQSGLSVLFCYGREQVYILLSLQEEGWGYYFRTAFASRHSKTNGIENIIKWSIFLSLVFLEHTSSLLYHFLFHSKQSPLLLTLVSNLTSNYFEGNPEKEVAFCVKKVFFIRSLKIVQLILIMHACI